jgi:hypothetical protein
MNHLKDAELEAKLKSLAKEERDTLAQVLLYIREAERRKLYLRRGCSSLFAYLTKDLQYSPPAAQRRIDAARLSADLPEIIDQIRDGTLSLAQVGSLQKGIRHKRKKSTVSCEMKRDALKRIIAAPSGDADKIVAKFFDMPIVRRTQAVRQKDESVRLSVTIPPEVWKNLERCKELLAHKLADADWPEILAELCEKFLSAKDPLRRTAASAAEVNAKAKKHGAIPVKLRRFIFQRDKVCQYRDATTKRICGSAFRLEVDHIQMRCHGGTNEPSNLRLLCRSHNQLAAEDALGRPGPSTKVKVETTAQGDPSDRNPPSGDLSQ